MDTIVAITGRRPLELLSELGRRSVLVDREIPFDMALLADVPVQADLA
jgi:hypothetical protein